MSAVSFSFFLFFFCTYHNRVLPWAELLTKIYCGCHENVPGRLSAEGT